MRILSKLRPVLPIIFFLFLTCAFYYQSILKNKIPVPADILLGAYYPWLDYDWGYAVSMPIKNPLISDIYSQFYPWKSLIAESIRQAQIPFWNPYSYSGYPLLANFHSGAFNPFNLLMVIFGDQTGWLLMLMSQMFFSMLFMYLFLSTGTKSFLPNVFASTVYGLSAFSICWSQFMTAGFALVFLPLIFFLIKQQKYFYLPFAYFLLMSSGHMQSLFFGFVFSLAYYLYLYRPTRPKQIIPLVLISVLSLGLMAIQLAPTLEASVLSIRNDEKYIQAYNYGLLPLANMVTFLSPDFFGNPATNNYWGFFNYHETIIYSSIIAIVAFTYFFINFKSNNYSKFFFFSSLLVLLLIFDNPLSKAFYSSGIPFITTSAAGRLVFVLTFSLAVLIRDFLVTFNQKVNRSKLSYTLVFLSLILFSQLFLSYLLRQYFLTLGSDFEWYKNLNTAFRNTALFSILIFIFVILSFLSSINKKFLYILFIFTLAEQFRFAWKYLPFVDRNYVFASTPVIEYLKNDPEKYFRVIAEKGPILPANSWSIYRLASPLGYDPVSVKDYYLEFNQTVNQRPLDKGVSRYLDTEIYSPDILGKYNVKYLLAVKRDKNGYSSASGQINHQKIDSRMWEEVFQDRSVVVLKNKAYQPRVTLIDTNNQKLLPQAHIIKYTPNEVHISFSVPEGKKATLLLSDSYYPGWTAYLNGHKLSDYNHKASQRSVEVSGTGNLIYHYFPKSFIIGLSITIASLIFHLFLTITKKYD